MRSLQIVVSMTLALLLYSTCTAQGSAGGESDADYDSIIVWIEGDFTSTKHHEHNASYADIELHIKRIWLDRDDGAWFYSEEAFRTTPEAPYKQRIYQVNRVEEGMLEGVVFTMDGADSLVGAWRDTTLVESLSSDDLRLRIGCEMYFQATGVSYIGGTHGTACRADVEGVSYVVSEVTIEWDKIVVSERGYDSSDRQVWGSETGPYWFFRE